MLTCPYCGEETNAYEGIYVDTETNTVFIDGKRLDLTRRESELFSAIYSIVPRVARISFLMDYIYGLNPETDDPDANILKVFMTRIRKKLKPTRFEIETIWGIGYRLKERNGKNIKRGTGKDNLPSVHYSFPGRSS